MLAVFLDSETLDRGDLDLGPLLEVAPGLTVYPFTDPGDVAERIADAEVVILNKVRMNAELIRSADKLKLICLAATGSDNVDMQAAKQCGVRVCNIQAYCSASVAQHVFAMILSLNQYLDDFDSLSRGGAWQRHPHFCMLSRPQRELAGLTLGIIGYGELGKAVASVANAFGMQVLLCQRPADPNPPEDRVHLDALLQRSDVVSLHCPLNDHTHHLIGEEQLALMKPDALLINTARGALVEPLALARALRESKIGGAGIDVLEQEPPINGNPLLDPDIPRLIVTPHIAWATLQARQRAVSQMAENIQAYRDGSLVRRLI